jgi:hypothetical protein
LRLPFGKNISVFKIQSAGCAVKICSIANLLRQPHKFSWFSNSRIIQNCKNEEGFHSTSRSHVNHFTRKKHTWTDGCDMFFYKTGEAPASASKWCIWPLLNLLYVRRQRKSILTFHGSHKVATWMSQRKIIQVRWYINSLFY